MGWLSLSSLTWASPHPAHGPISAQLGSSVPAPVMLEDCWYHILVFCSSWMDPGPGFSPCCVCCGTLPLAPFSTHHGQVLLGAPPVLGSPWLLAHPPTWSSLALVDPWHSSPGPLNLPGAQTFSHLNPSHLCGNLEKSVKFRTGYTPIKFQTALQSPVGFLISFCSSRVILTPNSLIRKGSRKIWYFKCFSYDSLMNLCFRILFYLRAPSSARDTCSLHNNSQ